MLFPMRAYVFQVACEVEFVRPLSWPTLSELLVQFEQAFLSKDLNGTDVSVADKADSPARAWQQLRAKREWRGAIAALEHLLLQFTELNLSAVEKQSLTTDLGQPAFQGLVLSGPSAILSHATLVAHFQTWIFSAEPAALALLPFCHSSAEADEEQGPSNAPRSVMLLPADPLTTEQFCLVLTSSFSMVMVLREGLDREPAFIFSFEPEVVQKSWQLLRPRCLLTNPAEVNQIDALLEQFSPIDPDYKVVMQFSRLLLRNLPDLTALDSKRASLLLDRLPAEVSRTNSLPQTPEQSNSSGRKTTFREHSVKQTAYGRFESLGDPQSSLDIELLQAIAHEIRTPLTTIRTLTRLLLKRDDLASDVKGRLDIIDRECTEQIDRFGLIFRAVELETAPIERSSINLTATSLAEVLRNGIPRWQKQARRHNLTLDVKLPKKLPTVVSNPALLDQVLTGLVENVTRRLPSGSYIRVQVMLAGDQLKLKLQAQLQDDQKSAKQAADKPLLSQKAICFPKTAKPIGQLLMFQPETGSLSLNLAVTKQLFQALGGRLIVRQRPQQGEVMTIFLPLEVGSHI